MSFGRQALLLDFDGTVVDSVELIYECLDLTTRELLATPFPRQLWEDNIGKPLDQTFALLGPAAVAHCQPLIARYRQEQVDRTAQLRPFPGIPESLAQLRAGGVRLAIVTTKLRQVAIDHLQAIGLRDLFEVVIGYDDCAAPKPDPQPFQLAMKALDVLPQQCAAAGDTAHDVHGARAAGVWAAAALWSGVAIPDLLAAQPDRVLHQPADLLTL